MSISRRALLQAGLAAALPTLGYAAPRAPAKPQSRVIVIGGGFGGATCAKYLRQLSPKTEVTLIERRGSFYTGPFSNLVLAGVRTPASVTIDMSAVGAALGVRTLVDEVIAIDPITRTVTTAESGLLQADRVVVAPGIAMRWDVIEGLDATNSASMPHAWTGDGQLLELRDRLDAVPDGGTIVIGAPANPYRCPPGPYERASLIAHRLSQTDRSRCKILIADAKDDFTKRALFMLEWDQLYPGMIEWIPRAQGGEIIRVDTTTGEVWLRGDDQKSMATHLASIVPPQRAAEIAASADLIDESGWCPVNAATMESSRYPGIYVLGDAAILAPVPKSAFAANSAAKLCASAIASALNHGPAVDPQVLNTCYSFVSSNQAISVSARYSAVNGRFSVLSDGVSPLSGDLAVRQREARQARDWYTGITADSFGVIPPEQ